MNISPAKAWSVLVASLVALATWTVTTAHSNDARIGVLESKQETDERQTRELEEIRSKLDSLTLALSQVAAIMLMEHRTQIQLPGLGTVTLSPPIENAEDTEQVQTTLDAELRVRGLKRD